MIEQITQINFSEPQWFALFLVIPLLVFWHIKKLRKNTPQLLVNANIAEFGADNSLSPLDYLFILRILALGFLIAALANPQVVIKKRERSQASKTDIIFALDASKSMLIEDIKPNRIGALKDVLNRFVAMRSKDRMGIVLYAGESMNWCPITNDYSLLLSRISNMEENNLEDGTAIGSGLVSAVKMLRKSTVKSKVIILLTDGENNAGLIEPLKAAQLAKQSNIKVYCVGIGKNGFAPFPLVGLDGKKQYQNIRVTLNEPMLKKIATTTSGAYFNATNAAALKNIYASINKKETKQDKWITKMSYESCLSWFISVALLILCCELLLKNTILRSFPI
jgi:Ca-activated chloride channel family protein